MDTAEAMTVIEKLEDLGWTTDTVWEDTTNPWDRLEAAIHELCHNVLLDGLDTPRDMGDTDRLIGHPTLKTDMDEIKTTAMSLAVFSLYQVGTQCDTQALESVTSNICNKKLKLAAADKAVEMSYKTYIIRLAQQVVDYIDSL